MEKKLIQAIALTRKRIMAIVDLTYRGTDKHSTVRKQLMAATSCEELLQVMLDASQEAPSRRRKYVEPDLLVDIDDDDEPSLTKSKESRQ